MFLIILILWPVASKNLSGSLSRIKAYIKIVYHNIFAGHRLTGPPAYLPTGPPAHRPTGNLPVTRRASPSLTIGRAIMLTILPIRPLPGTISMFFLSWTAWCLYILILCYWLQISIYILFEDTGGPGQSALWKMVWPTEATKRVTFAYLHYCYWWCNRSVASWRPHFHVDCTSIGYAATLVAHQCLSMKQCCKNSHRRPILQFISNTLSNLARFISSDVGFCGNN